MIQFLNVHPTLGLLCSSLHSMGQHYIGIGRVKNIQNSDPLPYLSAMAVGKNSQDNHSKTLSAAYHRVDMQALCQDFANTEPKLCMGTMISLL